MIDERMNIAVTKSNLVLDNITISENEKIVPTSKIINAVKNITRTKIGIDYVSFSKLQIDGNYGAMMRVIEKEKEKEKENEKIAEIFINSDNDKEYQRFSLVHELGHLITNHHNVNQKDFIISAHINQNVFSIDEKDYSDNTYLLNEQIANVFALRTLIPFKELMMRLEKTGDLNKIANSFGVTKEAIISRIALGE